MVGINRLNIPALDTFSEQLRGSLPYKGTPPPPGFPTFLQINEQPELRTP